MDVTETYRGRVMELEKGEDNYVLEGHRVTMLQLQGSLVQVISSLSWND